MLPHSMIPQRKVHQRRRRSRQHCAERICCNITSKMGESILIGINNLEANNPLRVVLNLHVRLVKETGTGGGKRIFVCKSGYAIHERRGVDLLLPDF